MKKLPVALQVYSIREDAENDFRKAMLEIKQMGYDGVELAGLYGHSPDEVKECLLDIGLIPVSAHVSYEMLIEDLQGTVECYAAIGCKYIAISYIEEESRYGSEKFTEFISNIPVIAKACESVGMTLLYHNHEFEFLKTLEGEYVLDYIYRIIPEKDLKAEIDTCWVKYSGVDPVEYLGKYHGRCPIVHIKDFYLKEPIEFAPVGYGVQGMPDILNKAINSGCEWVIVEQDSHTERTALEDVRLSKEYLKKLGW